VTLAEAKARLTIHGLWRRFGFKGQPAKSCPCPFHEDRTSSFSVFRGRDGGDAFKCFAGCGGGDAVEFLALATRLPMPEACREFIRLAGGVSSAPKLILPPIESLGQLMERCLRKTADADEEKAKKREKWPVFESPLTGEDDTPARAMGALAKLRHVSLEGVRLMAARGLLWFAAWKGKPSWIVTDGERVNAQARRMDGKQWEGINAKAQTLRGSCASWPIGLKESTPYPYVLLCEGGPDLLAAHHFIHTHGRKEDTAAVAMLGAGNKIPADAPPLFADRNIPEACYPVQWPEPGEPVQFPCKHVRIFAHADNPGRTAAKKWAEQLESTGATVDAADFTGLLMADRSPVKDLNDCTRLDFKQTQELDNLIPQ